jgi:DNA-binding XRE family transcriptional regulator
VFLLLPTNQIPVYLEGQAVGLAAPLMLVERVKTRQWKKESKGYFVSHGKAFVLYREAAAETELRVGMSKDNDRMRDTPKTCDESASIQPPTMDDYVDGRRTARVAVDCWRRTNMNLKELRKMAGLTQWELAQRCGVSRMRLSLAECEQVDVHPEEETSVRGVLLEVIKNRAAQLRGVLSGSESLAV